MESTLVLGSPDGIVVDFTSSPFGESDPYLRSETKPRRIRSRIFLGGTDGCQQGRGRWNHNMPRGRLRRVEGGQRGVARTNLVADEWIDACRMVGRTYFMYTTRGNRLRNTTTCRCRDECALPQKQKKHMLEGSRII